VLRVTCLSDCLAQCESTDWLAFGYHTRVWTFMSPPMWCNKNWIIPLKAQGPAYITFNSCSVFTVYYKFFLLLLSRTRNGLNTVITLVTYPVLASYILRGGKGCERGGGPFLVIWHAILASFSIMEARIGNHMRDKHVIGYWICALRSHQAKRC